DRAGRLAAAPDRPGHGAGRRGIGADPGAAGCRRQSHGDAGQPGQSVVVLPAPGLSAGPGTGLWAAGHLGPANHPARAVIDTLCPDLAAPPVDADPPVETV